MRTKLIIYSNRRYDDENDQQFVDSILILLKHSTANIYIVYVWKRVQIEKVMPRKKRQTKRNETIGKYVYVKQTHTHTNTLCLVFSLEYFVWIYIYENLNDVAEEPMKRKQTKLETYRRV